MALKTEIDILAFDKDLRQSYERYIYTANLISDQEPSLQSSFYGKLSKEFSVLRGPYVHCTPCYKLSYTLEELISGKGEIKLSAHLAKLPRDEFAPDRPLYTHQVEALDILTKGKNLVVATGTGSGKTECFLLPILNDILENPEPGLRAIMIYPMNALADDQLGRLRRMLGPIPEVTFGRYTGDTPETIEEPKRPIEVVQNERFTRREIRLNPPHILLTNFAMLEYLLLRPHDSDIFKRNRLRFIVLDEAHSYSGAQGIEIALLMRRLREYLLNEEGKVQFVLTSATLGDETDASENVARFGFDISGMPFETKTVLQGETIDEFLPDLQPFPSVEVLLSIGASGQSIELWTGVLEDAEALAKRLAEFKIECGGYSGRSASRLLFDLFCVSEPLNRLHQQCRHKPSTLIDICELLQLPLDNIGQKAVQWLITMGSYARRTPDASPLLPTRVHFFARGLAGATVCLSDACPGKQSHPNTGWSSFFLEDRNVCQHCESNVLPLLTCVHCGLPISRVFLVNEKWQVSSPLNDIPNARLLTWSTSYNEYSADEDESSGRKAWVCLQCGTYSEEKDRPISCGAHNVARLSVIEGDKEGNGNLTVCPRCGGQHGAYASVLRDFRTRDDAPTAVLAETLIRNLPFDEKDEERAEMPAHGRNLLVFSDARQRAAFFAPYLEQTTLETAYLGPLVSAITEEEKKESRPVSFEEITGAYVRGMESRRMSIVKKRDKNGIDYFDLIPKKRLRSSDKSAAAHAVELILYQNFCSSYRNKTSLPGSGVASLSFDFNEEEREKLPELIPEIFRVNNSAGWDGLYALLNIFITRRAIALPHDISTRDILNPGPKAVTYHLTLSGNHEGRQVVRWNPYLATKSVKLSLSKSRQLDIVARLTKMDKEENASELSDILLRIWEAFKNSMLLEAESWPGEFRLDPSLVQVTRQRPWGLCDRCGRLTTLINLGFCLTSGCQGNVKNLGADEIDKLFERNHYRQRYFLPPLEIRVKEHTAQLTNECGKEYQRKFMSGEINVLSSSTTFEMGVDVGSLKAVLLRNVPPTTSSYIQRAGRAGRRKDGVSVALTFCRNLPHDQYHYQKPEAIILGRVPSPYLNLRNEPLTQRHCNSLLLGYYLRSVADVDVKELDKLTINTFFLLPDEHKSLAMRYETWLGEMTNRRKMISSVKGILPQEARLVPEEVLRSSVDTLLHMPDGVFNYHVRQPLQQLANQFAEIEKQLKTTSGPIRIALARSSASLDRLIRQFKEERLIDFLSSCSWLPGYAFPQDIVKLLVRQDEYSQRMRLQRDREIGISEYAPGAEIVADGWLFTSGGIWFNSREPEIRKYARCPECRKIDRYLETERPSKECSRCGTKLSGKFLPRPYIRPEGFTTLVTDTVRRPGMSRRPGARTTEIFLLEGAAPKDFREHRLKGISFAEKRGGQLFLANSGFQYRGYQVCRKCGRGYPEEPLNKTHETPWGTKCTGSVLRMDLAHEIMTDILQLRFRDCTPSPPPIMEKPFWMSFVAAFLNGASDALNIKGSDLGGTYHGWTEESFVGELVVYDRIPGGAGHISRIVTNLEDVLKAALERVRDCKCPDLEASCYACLRSYNNQFYWEQLKRKPVIDWLSRILEE
jgi:hypothetical protein